jgi:regulator of protease activity HflC (stomatin/prohibitin superfamily)
MIEERKERTKLFFFKENRFGKWGLHWVRVIPAFVLLIFLLISLFASIITVGVGEAALIIHPLAGGDAKVSGPITGPAFGFYKNPYFLESSVVIYYEIDTLGMWGDGSDPYADFPAVAAFSRDQLEMQMDIMIRWSLDPSKLVDIYRKYPNLDYKDKVIASIAREQLRIITSTQFSAIETIENRGLVADKIKAAILQKLATEPTLYGAILNFEFDLRNIEYPEIYTAAVEAKLAAEQQMKQAEFEKQKIIILAEADAEKVTINAQALANATVLQSMGKADAINFIANQTGIQSADLTKYFLWLETLREIKPNFIYIMGQNQTSSFIYPLTPSTG